MAAPAPRVLIVAADRDDIRRLDAALRASGCEVTWVRDGESARNAAMRAEPIDALVCEASAPRIDGLATLGAVLARHPRACAVLATEREDVEIAVEAMRRGASDVQTHPLHADKVRAVIARGLERQALERQVVDLQDELGRRLGEEGLAGNSRAIQRVLDQVRHLAASPHPVMLRGDSGTGKGIVARALHFAGPRRAMPFVWVQCGAVSERLLEAELFGAEAADGASRSGALERAEGGSCFLEDIGAVPPSVQVRLLRLLHERAFERVGGQDTRRANVRLIVASSRDLAPDVRERAFREDLFHRLSLVTIDVPGLRERREDIPVLAEQFARLFAKRHRRRAAGLTRGALDRLVAYDWPGHVRELKNVVEGMVLLAEPGARLDVSHLPPGLRDGEPRVGPLSIQVGMTVEEAERELVEATLRHVGGDKPRAAEILGIALRTLYRKLDRWGPR